MEPATRPYLRELPGRIAPTRIAEVRARVPGIVMVRTFEQGSEVSAGDVLYQLDPAPYEVELRRHRGGARQGHGGARAGNAAGPARRGAGRDARRLRSRSTRSPRLGCARPRPTSPRARPTSRAPGSISTTRRSARRSAAASAARWSPRARWSGRAKRPISPRSSSSTRSMPTSPSRSPRCNQLRRALAKGDLEAAGPEAAKVRLVLDNGEAYRARRQAAVLRHHRRSEHRTGHAARRVPQSERRAAARHVCPRADRAGRRSRRARGAAAGGSPQRRRHERSVRPARRQSRRGCSRSGSAGWSAATG